MANYYDINSPGVNALRREFRRAGFRLVELNQPHVVSCSISAEDRVNRIHGGFAIKPLDKSEAATIFKAAPAVAYEANLWKLLEDLQAFLESDHDIVVSDGVDGQPPAADRGSQNCASGTCRLPGRWSGRASVDRKGGPH